MPSFIKHTISQNDFILSSDKIVFWEQEKILILSDLHLGKSGHFRKSGIAIPHAVMKEDMQRLISALQFFKPELVVIVGDLFHSVENKEHELFLKWRNDLQHVPILLVKGNHDIVPETWYKNAGIETAERIWRRNNFLFVHHIEDVTEEEINDADYFFSGHIHPAVSIKGLGKQSLRFPCFYFTQKYAVLPAFGKFTGTYLVEPSKKEKAFAIVNNSIVSI
ncbi:ligase-associated DNA damage response endonuclease PdeM [Ferruginibacter sp.]|nr:ligase-associated DNA damage response endonuclease PdeM [Ferruginibacter sp.]